MPYFRNVKFEPSVLLDGGTHADSENRSTFGVNTDLRGTFITDSALAKTGVNASLESVTAKDSAQLELGEGSSAAGSTLQRTARLELATGAQCKGSTFDGGSLVGGNNASADKMRLSKYSRALLGAEAQTDSSSLAEHSHLTVLPGGKMLNSTIEGKVSVASKADVHRVTKTGPGLLVFLDNAKVSDSTFHCPDNGTPTIIDSKITNSIFRGSTILPGTTQGRIVYSSEIDDDSLTQASQIDYEQIHPDMHDMLKHQIKALREPAQAQEPSTRHGVHATRPGPVLAARSGNNSVGTIHAIGNGRIQVGNTYGDAASLPGVHVGNQYSQEVLDMFKRMGMPPS